MRERELPREMRITLRDYFTNARNVHAVSGDSDLLAKMSPLLQGTVACRANKPWLDQIWFMRNLGQTREEREVGHPPHAHTALPASSVALASLCAPHPDSPSSAL